MAVEDNHEKKGKLVPEKKRRRPQRPVKAILPHFWPFIYPHRWAIIFGTTFVLIMLIVEKVRPLVTKYLVDHALTPMLQEDWSDSLYRETLSIALVAVGLMLVLTIVAALLSRAHMFIMHRAGAAMVKHLRVFLFRHLQNLPLSYFESRQTGEIMSRLTGDVDAMERLITHVSDQVVNNLLNLLITLIILFALSWQLALVALIPVPLLVFAAVRFSRRIRPAYRAVRDYFGAITARLQDSLAGIRVIKSFHTEEPENRHFEEQNEEHYNRQITAMKLWTAVFPLVHFLQGFGVVLVTAVGAYMLLQPVPLITLGTLFAFNAYVMQLYSPISTLFRMYDWMLRALASGERIVEVIESTPEEPDLPDAKELDTVEGYVEFRNVSFQYPSGGPVLKDISIKVKPGDIVALVGRSGAGKTSLVNLIPRLYDPTKGRILVDGHDVRKISRDSLRRQISIVLQDPFLFNGTVRENISYARPEASEEEIVEAARASYAHGFINNLANGYDTEIGERGVKLSGGQKQRLAIARALLANRRILILDEATAMVDSEAEYEIQQALRRLMKGRTTFVIAHRLSTIKNASQIVTLDDGSVVEHGDHHSLLALNGTYSQMYHAQFRLALEDEDAVGEGEPPVY